MNLHLIHAVLSVTCLQTGSADRPSQDAKAPLLPLGSHMPRFLKVDLIDRDQFKAFEC